MWGLYMVYLYLVSQDYEFCNVQQNESTLTHFFKFCPHYNFLLLFRQCLCSPGCLQTHYVD